MSKATFSRALLLLKYPFGISLVLPCARISAVKQINIDDTGNTKRSPKIRKGCYYGIFFKKKKKRRVTRIENRKCLTNENSLHGI